MVARGFSSAMKCPASMPLPSTATHQFRQTSSGVAACAGNPSSPQSARHIGLVDRAIDGRAGAIVVAGTVNMPRFGEARSVIGQGFGMEGGKILRARPA